MSLLSLLIDFRYDMTSLIKTIHIYGPSFSHEYLYGYVRSYLHIIILSPLHIKDIGIHWWFNQEMVLHNLTNKQNMFCGLFAVVMNNVCYLEFIRFFHLKMQLWQMWNKNGLRVNPDVLSKITWMSFYFCKCI